MDKRKEELKVGDVIQYPQQPGYQRWPEYLVITRAAPIGGMLKAKDLFSDNEESYALNFAYTYLCHINDFGSV